MSEYTDIATIPQIVNDLRKGFNTHCTQKVEWRLQQLNNLHTMLSLPANREAICHAMYLDLGRSRFEGIMYEIDIALGDIEHFIHELSTNPNFDIQRVGSNLLNQPASSFIRNDPYGVALISSPWNYPVLLCLQPLAGALASGNTCLIRPGTYSKHTSSCLQTLIHKHFDKAFVNAVIGERDVTSAMLKEKFDIICFTGGPTLGAVYHKAANQHLTPCLLELGGSNPTIIWKDANISVTAKRLVSTAFMNLGQTCIRPQIFFTHVDIVDEFIQEMKQNINSFYTIGNDITEYRVQQSYEAYSKTVPADKKLSITDWVKEQDQLARERALQFKTTPITDPSYKSNAEFMKHSPWLGRVINNDAFNRLTNLIQQDREFVVFGGDSDPSDRFIAPTIMVFKDIRDFNNAKSVKDGEIFGPIITILAIDNLSQTIDWINQHDKPLSLYCYSFDKVVQQEVLENTSSGSLVFNDSVLQVSNAELPFGGVGKSGMGAYHGKHSLQSFSHQKAVLSKGKINCMFDAPIRYPPYTQSSQSLMSSAAGMERQNFSWLTIPFVGIATYGIYFVLPYAIPYLQQGLDMIKSFYNMPQ